MALSLLRRFPKLRASSESEPVIPKKARDDYPGRGAYPQLAHDFEVLDREVAPAFTEYDAAALRDQNRYRRQQVIIILGAALVTGLGGLQAVFPHQRWPGLLLGALGIALSVTAGVAKDRAALDGYLSARIKAERLRACTSGTYPLPADTPPTVEQIFRTENGQWGQLVIQGTPPDPAPGTGTGGP